MNPIPTTDTLTGLTPNQTKFREVYLRKLQEAIEQNPGSYGYPASEAEIVVHKMLVAIGRDSYNKEGPAFKATCKELGIKYTYAAINTYWKS